MWEVNKAVNFVKALSLPLIQKVHEYLMGNPPTSIWPANYTTAKVLIWLYDSLKYCFYAPEFVLRNIYLFVTTVCLGKYSSNAFKSCPTINSFPVNMRVLRDVFVGAQFWDCKYFFRCCFICDRTVLDDKRSASNSKRQD